MRRLLFITRRPPFPLDNGARIRAQRLAHGLSEHFAVTLATFDGGPRHDETEATDADLAQALPRVEVVRIALPARKGPGPFLASRDWGPFAAGREAVLALVGRLGPDVVHLDDPGAGLAGIGAAAPLVAFAPHNVEHRILRALAAAASGRSRLGLEREWRLVRREERRLWTSADLCVAVSDLDAAAMEGAREVYVAPNGTDPDELPPPRTRDTVRLLFVGSGNFGPYARGLAWFVREVLPRLDRVTLDVVGEKPAEPVEAPGVIYHGRVAAVRPFYERADALVVPVFEGSGTRLKVVEAAMLNRPVISTALGAEGLPVEFLRADEDPEEWVAAVRRVRDEDLEPLLARARDSVQELTWPRIAERLAERYSTSTR